MLRSSIFLGLLAACGALLPIACVQDFSVFEPGPSSGSGGGGGSTTSVGSSSGSNSGSGSSASSSSSAGGGGGNPTGETNCNDGTDNDGDSDADCGDSDCTTTAGYACVNPPAGWTGPIALFEGTSAILPSCPSSFPTQAFVGRSGVSVPIHTCNDCSCAPLAVNCAAASVEFFSETSCTGVPVLTLTQSAACTQIPAAVQRAEILAPTPTAAAECTKSGGGVAGSLPAVTFGANAIGCTAAGPGEGCDGSGANAACTPPSTAEFNQICVFRRMNAGACPGDFPVRHTYSEQFNDTRGCSDCDCGNPNPAPACTAQTTAFATTDCTGPSTNLNNNGVCLDASAATNGSFTLTSVTPNAPLCAKSGGAPTGTVAPVPGSAIIVCCRN
jgi:hypothetical protein